MVATKGDFVSRLGDWKRLTFTKERALGLEGWLCSPGARNHPFRPMGLLRQMNELVMFIHDQQNVHCSPLAYLTVYGPEAPSAAPSGECVNNRAWAGAWSLGARYMKVGNILPATGFELSVSISDPYLGPLDQRFNCLSGTYLDS
jgi:hypothetical protein